MGVQIYRDRTTITEEHRPSLQKKSSVYKHKKTLSFYASIQHVKNAI